MKNTFTKNEFIQRKMINDVVLSHRWWIWRNYTRPLVLCIKPKTDIIVLADRRIHSSIHIYMFCLAQGRDVCTYLYMYIWRGTCGIQITMKPKIKNSSFQIINTTRTFTLFIVIITEMVYPSNGISHHRYSCIYIYS